MCRRNNGGYNNGGYNNNGYNNDRDRNNYGNNYGRKLKQGGIVANIICDTVGNCNDNGRRYYDGNRDDRWATPSDHLHTERGSFEASQLQYGRGRLLL